MLKDTEKVDNLNCWSLKLAQNLIYHLRFLESTPVVPLSQFSIVGNLDHRRLFVSLSSRRVDWSSTVTDKCLACVLLDVKLTQFISRCRK